MSTASEPKMSSVVPPERLLTPQEVSEWLGIPAKTLANWRSERIGPLPLRIGNHVRYRSVDVHAWLEERAAAARSWMLT